MRYRYLIDDLGQAELDAVGGTYTSYFEVGFCEGALAVVRSGEKHAC